MRSILVSPSILARTRVQCLAAPLVAALVAVACDVRREAPPVAGTIDAAAGADADRTVERAAERAAARAAAATQCAEDNGGITLPPGFCAAVFADAVGGARHITVAPNGDVFVALQTSRARREAGQAPRGGVLALRDTTGDGRADVQEYFGSLGGTGIVLSGEELYADAGSAIVRWRMPRGQLTPAAGPDTIVRGLPMGGHAAKSLALDGRGALYVNIGSRTNSCQQKDRAAGSPGHDPCTELETRAGVWRFDARRTGQTQESGTRVATGNRNALGLAFAPDGGLYATQHGRDQLHQHFPQYYSEEDGAELPAEELLRLDAGADFGWPYCYYDHRQGKRILAPEYGGDGKKVGRCASFTPPVAAFPGHWAPNALLFYSGRQFPASYRGGAFIAFHGSWNRAPRPQQGFKVVFVPFRDGRAGKYEVFADGFGGPDAGTGGARHKPSGLAQGPDGALYVTDDRGGRIWKIVYRGPGR